jgi:dTMP kinase
VSVQTYPGSPLIPVPPPGRGLFVVFEGGEGAGKSFQAELLASHLRLDGVPHLLTHEPGGTVHGADIRRMLLESPAGSITAQAEALLFLADRALHVSQVIGPALERGEVVICDRYVDSSCVYQGYARGLGYGHIRQLCEWATDGLAPDLVFLLDIDPELGLARAAEAGGGTADRIEAEDMTFHRQVRRWFRKVAEAGVARHQYGLSPTEYVVLDASGPRTRIANQVLTIVTARLHHLTIDAEPADSVDAEATLSQPEGR